MTSNLQYTFNNDSSTPDDIWDSMFQAHLDEEKEMEEEHYDDRPLNFERE